jgi:hypothetical protein
VRLESTLREKKKSIVTPPSGHAGVPEVRLENGERGGCQTGEDVPRNRHEQGRRH